MSSAGREGSEDTSSYSESPSLSPPCPPLASATDWDQRRSLSRESEQSPQSKPTRNGRGFRCAAPGKAQISSLIQNPGASHRPTAKRDIGIGSEPGPRVW